MMYPKLYQYLLLYKQLPVPGIGTFLLERKPARLDFANKEMYPPEYSFTLKDETGAPSKFFFNWLGSALDISDRDAVIRYNDFVFDLKKNIQEGNTITWNEVGILQKGMAGEIKFIPGKTSVAAQSIPAVKVLREKAEHTVRVGEEEKTSSEMEEMLTRHSEKKSYWWAYALVIGLLAVIFIGWYLSEHGVALSSTANGAKVSPSGTAATYKELR